MPLNLTAFDRMLDALDEASPPTGAFITHVGIGIMRDSDTTGSPGTGTTPNASSEPAHVGDPDYSRRAVTWGASASGVKANTNAFSTSAAFHVPANTAGEYYGYFTFWGNDGSASQTTAYYGYAPFFTGSAVKGFGVVDALATVGGLTLDVVNSTAHGLVAGDRVHVYNVLQETLPAATPTLNEIRPYYVINPAAGANADSFRLSLTSGGSAIDLTGVGELYFQKALGQAFAAAGDITCAAAQLSIDARVL